MTEELLKYFNFDELAASVWLNKYAAEGEITPDQMHRRMAKEFARVDMNYQKQEAIDKRTLTKLSKYGQKRKPLTEESIYSLFKGFKYIVPQGRVQAGLGITSSYRSLSNCLRLPSPNDSYSSIMYSDTMLVSAAKRGCGYGLGISKLRPEEAEVKNSAGSSTGAVSFMERFSNSTREVAQLGRRGACLLDIDVRHPDVLKFIAIKQDKVKVTGANISVFLHDDFMQAVEKDADYILRWPTDMEVIEGYEPDNYNELVKIPKENIYFKKAKAKDIWDKLVEAAATSAEPGVFFRDRMTEYSPSNVYPSYFEDGTNACGEQPMAIFDTCRLILSNLFSFVDNPFTDTATINFNKVYKVHYEMLRLADDLVDLEIEYIDRIIDKIKSDPEPEEEKAIELTLWENVRSVAKNGRRVGAGITGLGDMLAALDIPYGSEESFREVEALFKVKMKAELDATIDLAILRGKFIGYDSSLEYGYDTEEGYSYCTDIAMNDFYAFLSSEFPEQQRRMIKYGRRNVNFSTIAPAGSVSLETQTTSGGEPLFKPYYTRRKKINPDDINNRVDYVDQNGDSWQEYPVLHPKFKDWVEKNWGYIGLPYSESPEFEVVDLLSKDELETVFKKSPWYGSTANDLDWWARIKMQAILQKYTTSAISSTLNLPKGTTKEQVGDIYMEAWKQGLKGCTVYVEGSRDGVLIENKKDDSGFDYKDSIKRPKDVEGHGYSVSVMGDRYYVIVGLVDGKPYEVFAMKNGKVNKEGILRKVKRGEYNFLTEDGDVIINSIESKMTDEQEAIARLISGSLRHGMDVKFVVEQLNKTSGTVVSFNKAIARTLKRYIPDGTKSTVTCDNCGSDNVVFENGCQVCKDCGNDKCS